MRKIPKLNFLGMLYYGWCLSRHKYLAIKAYIVQTMLYIYLPRNDFLMSSSITSFSSDDSFTAGRFLMLLVLVVVSRISVNGDIPVGCVFSNQIYAYKIIYFIQLQKMEGNLTSLV